PIVIRRSHASSPNARATEAASLAAASMLVTSAPAARAVSAIRCAVTSPPGSAHHQLLKSRRTGNQEIARRYAPSGARDRATLGNVMPPAPNPLPRDRFSEHLCERPGSINQIGIEHAVAAV